MSRAKQVTREGESCSKNINEGAQEVEQETLANRRNEHRENERKCGEVPNVLEWIFPLIVMLYADERVYMG